MDTKRIRFGFLCSDATSPVTSDMLPSIGLRSLECAMFEGKQYVMLTVDKAVRASDVLHSVAAFNTNVADEAARLNLEQFGDSQDLIVTFEKGQRYLQHPFFLIFQGVKSLVGIEPQMFWEWTSDGKSEPMKRKRATGELISDLVEDAINPSASKRERGSKTDTVEVILAMCRLVFIEQID